MQKNEKMDKLGDADYTGKNVNPPLNFICHTGIEHAIFFGCKNVHIICMSIIHNETPAYACPPLRFCRRAGVIMG